MSSEPLLSEYEELSVISRKDMEARAEHQKKKNYLTLYGTANVLGVTAIVLSFAWILKFRGGFGWSVSDPAHQFNWHPFLMLISLVFLYGQSILVYRTGRTSPKKSLKITHASLHCTAFVLAVIGLKAAFDSHNNKTPPTPNLYTLHSWIGLITMILFSMQLLVGFISFLFPGVSISLRQIIMPAHRALGTAGFILAISTSVMGMTEKAIWAIGDGYALYVSEGILVNFMGLLTLFFGILVVYLVTEIEYKRIPLAEDDLTLTSNELHDH